MQHEAWHNLLSSYCLTKAKDHQVTMLQYACISGMATLHVLTVELMLMGNEHAMLYAFTMYT